MVPGREERKVITVLFTDLVGFTSRAEELDPEDVRAMLSPYYARLREQIEQRGGTVEKFIGDAVMAVFGAPVAHDDDPVRAVLTALAIRDAVAEASPDLHIRTAVNTGEALVALDASPTDGEAMASGDVVNTAARLQSAAPTDGILVGEATYRATRHVIDYVEAPAVEAKGKSRPIPVWEVVAARPRYGTDVEQVHRSPLVGRARELVLLTDAFARAKSEQTAQLVTLVGIPGIGKSRLVAELFTTLDADPDVYWWRQGRSLPYGESRSVWALGEIVKAQAGILESDDDATAREKLATLVAELLPDAAERRWVESNLHALAGVAGEIDESGDRKLEAFSAWRRFFEALAEERPLVLVFEDLHWADDTLLDFVDYLAEWVTDVPVLLVGTARPELLERRPDWGGGKRNAATSSLGALSDEETAKLLPVLPAEMQQLVLQRAEGNPLYAEEYARMLADHPGNELSLPETVQGLIAARIDALPPHEKQLVQDASVLGKVFWPSALGSTDESQLHSLVRKEFIRRDRRSAVAGETQYAFIHLLVRDVAYGQIPRARRMEKHRAAAEWIAALSPDRSEDRAEMLAHHYREALRLADAAGIDAGELRAPARTALAEASERAAALSSWKAAHDLAQEALALTDVPDPELQLRLARAKAYAFADWDIPLAEEARDAFLAGGAVDQAAEAEAFLSWMYWWLGNGQRARAHTARALALIADRPSSLSKARAYAQAARLEVIGGDGTRAAELARQTLALAEELGRDDLQSSALNSLALAKAHGGDLSAIANLERAIELADRSNVPQEMFTSRNNLASILNGFGRVQESLARWEEARDLSRRVGSPPGALWAEMAIVVHNLSVGDLDATLAAVADIRTRIPEDSQIANAALIAHAWVLAVRGEIEEALAETAEAVERARRIGDPQAVAPALSSRVLALFLAGQDEDAFAAGSELLSNVRMDASMNSMLALTFTERGRGAEWLAAVADDTRPSTWITANTAVAEGDFLRAANIFADMGVDFLEAWARLIAAEHGELSQLEPARAFFAEHDATPFLRRCEAVLAASA